MADPQSGSMKTSVIRRVEDEADEKTKEENKDNEKQEDINVKPSQICSPIISKPLLTSSKFGGSNPFTSNNATLSTTKFGNKSVLKPPKLGPNSSVQTVKNPFMLNPSRLNPFSKAPAEENSGNSDSDKTVVNVSAAASATNGETPKFVPLLQTESKNSEIIVKPVTTVLPTTTQASQSFVFGQNLQERVIADGSDDPKPSTSCVNANGTSEMLFSSAIKDSVKSENSDMTSRETKSLSESAREYEESRATKRKYEEVEIKTGEEEETNVLHVSCKLFSYDKASGNWQERGRGNIRLNDLEVVDNCTAYKQSRLVFRTSGSLRVILNTKIWADMTIQQASAKSIRLTAIDSCGEIKVYLIMASSEDVTKLYKHLDDRVRSEIDRQHLKTTSFGDDNNRKNTHSNLEAD